MQTYLKDYNRTLAKKLIDKAKFLNQFEEETIEGRTKLVEWLVERQDNVKLRERQTN